jgi:hypothetical protein
MLAVTALQLDVFSHIHWQLDDVLVGAKLAVPCIAIDAALLVLYTTLSGPASAQHLSSSSSTTSSISETSSSGPNSSRPQQIDQAAGKAALLSAMHLVNLHNIRYSLIGAAAPGPRLALEAGAQASEELLARGALLGCASAWLTNRCVGVMGVEGGVLLAQSWPLQQMHWQWRKHCRGGAMLGCI